MRGWWVEKSSLLVNENQEEVIIFFREVSQKNVASTIKYIFFTFHGIPVFF
jgi:hypothetical protein